MPPTVVSLRPENPPRNTIEAEIRVRMRELREAAQLTQGQMAALLGCGMEQYRKYETRSPMALGYLAKFCMIVKCDLQFLITGQRRQAAAKPRKPPADVAQFPVGKSTKRNKRAKF